MKFSLGGSCLLIVITGALWAIPGLSAELLQRVSDIPGVDLRRTVAERSGSTGLQRGDSVQDQDWNTRFTSNCPLPHHDAIKWVSESNRRYVRFSLSDGDKGGCSTDRTARHSAPYWERAELRQVGTLRKNKSYTINATLRFVEGFSGQRESFFQIHAANKKCKQAYPPIMMKFDKTHTSNAVLTLSALKNYNRHHSYRSGMRIDDVLGKWVDMEIIVSTTDRGSVTVSIDGETLFSDVPFLIEPCGTPHIKFGVYRPGNLSGNDKSIVDFDSISVD